MYWRQIKILLPSPNFVVDEKSPHLQYLFNTNLDIVISTN